MHKRPTFDEFKALAMQDQAFKNEYDLLEPEFELIEKLIRARKKSVPAKKKIKRS